MIIKSEFLNLSDRVKSKATDQPGVLWLQGSASCSLAVIAVTLEHILARQGYKVALLDSDQINSGLCSDLCHSDLDRYEYSRRVAETAKLFAESNMLTIVMVDRLTDAEDNGVRDILQNTLFSSVYIESPNEREVAKSAAIRCVDGADGPLLAPKNAELHLNTAGVRAEDSINTLLEHLDRRGSLANGYSPLARPPSANPQASIHETEISIAAG